jgi:hypothetical protein
MTSTEQIIAFAVKRTLDEFLGGVFTSCYLNHLNLLSRAIISPGATRQLAIKQVRGNIAAMMTTSQKLLEQLPPDPQPPLAKKGLFEAKPTQPAGTMARAYEFESQMHLYLQGFHLAAAALQSFYGASFAIFQATDRTLAELKRRLAIERAKGTTAVSDPTIDHDIKAIESTEIAQLRVMVTQAQPMLCTYGVGTAQYK